MGETVSRRVFLANTGKLVGFCVLSHFAMVGKAEETFSGICASQNRLEPLEAVDFSIMYNRYESKLR